MAKVERWAPKRSRSQRRRAKTKAETEEIADVVLDGVARLAKRYNAAVVSDQHLPGVVREGLRRRGIDRDRVAIKAWNKNSLNDAFGSLRARIVAGSISLPKDKTLIEELGRIRTRAHSGGNLIEVPRTATSHADTALALASAVLLLDTKGVPRPMRTSGLHNSLNAPSGMPLLRGPRNT